MGRQTQAVIHLPALRHNLALLKSLAPISQCIPVVKADAYGHGAIQVATYLAEQADAFAVAIVEEAIPLREAGIRCPIIVLQGAHSKDDIELAATHDITLVAHREQQLVWATNSTSKNKPTLWLKVDTGMHRVGFAPQEVQLLVRRYADLFNDKSVLMTHLSAADDEKNTFTLTQIREFELVSQQLGWPVSVANSPATIAWPVSRRDFNRYGIAMYGGQALNRTSAKEANFRPVMSLTAAVIGLRTIALGETVGYGQSWVAKRQSLIATLGIGYADGYPRHCPIGTPIIINGKRCPLVGRVSMDMITVDVTDAGKIEIGQSAELWGQHLPISEVADKAKTITYELMTRLGPRVPRSYRY